MKRDLALNLIRNLSELLDIAPAAQTDNQVRAVAKLKSRICDAYMMRRAEQRYWDVDILKNPKFRRVLGLCLSYVAASDTELQLRNERRRAARRAAAAEAGLGSVEKSPSDAVRVPAPAASNG